jgi:hypothetical protein
VPLAWPSAPKCNGGRSKVPRRSNFIFRLDPQAFLPSNPHSFKLTRKKLMFEGRKQRYTLDGTPVVAQDIRST